MFFDYIFRKKKIGEFTTQLWLFLDHHFVRDERANLLKRLSKRLMFLIIYFMILYGIALYFNAVVINFEIKRVTVVPKHRLLTYYY